MKGGDQESGDRRGSLQRDGYEADTSDSNDKPSAPARRGRDQSPDKQQHQQQQQTINGRKAPKPSDVSPRPPEPYERAARNTFTGKSTLSLSVALSARNWRKFRNRPLTEIIYYYTVKISSSATFAIPADYTINVGD